MTSEGEPQATPSRRRGLALVAVPLIAVIFLGLPHLLRSWIQARLAARTGLHVAIAGVAPLWNPLGVALSGVELRSQSGSTRPLVHIPRLELPWGAAPPRWIGAVLRPEEATPATAVGAQKAVERAIVGDVVLVAPVLEIEGSERLLPDARLIRLAVELRPDGILFATGALAVAGGRLTGWARLHPRAPGVASLRGTGLELASLGRLWRVPAAQSISGTADGRLRFRWSRAGEARVRGWLAARGFRREEAGHAALALGTLELRGLDADLEARRLVARRLDARHGELVFRPVSDSPKESLARDPWSFAVPLLELRDVVVGSEIPQLPRLHIEALSVQQLGSPSGRFFLTAEANTGGRLRAAGELDTERPLFRADVDVEGATLGPWIEAFAPRVRWTSGELGGRFEIWGPPGVQGRGTLVLNSLRAVSVDPRPGAAAKKSVAGVGTPEHELLRLGGLRAALRGFTLIPPRVWLTNAEIDGPALTLTRTAAGLEPLDLFGADSPSAVGVSPPADGGIEATARALLAPLGALLGEAPPLTLPSIEVQATLRDGSLRFVDEQVTPPFSFVAERIEGNLAAWGGPPWGAVRAELSARAAEGSPLALRGEIDGSRLHIAGEVAALPLRAWNAYLGPAIGYVAQSGTMSASFDLRWEREVEAPIRLVLEDLALTRGSGEDRFAGTLGMPLDHALDLMRDTRGRTELVLRLEGDPREPGLGLVAALPAALREAVPEAVTVPLFEGSELVGGAGAEHVRLAPLSFRAGEAELLAEASRVLERLAVVLRWDPALVAIVGGRAERHEAKAGSGDGDASSAALATRRAEAVRERLVAGLGLAPERVRLAPSETGPPGVQIELRPMESPT